MEIRQIEEYDNYYVSDEGKVYRDWYGELRELKGMKNSVGYRYMVLCKDGVYKLFNLHRLVAKAFVPNPDNLPEVDHIDGDKVNNAANNLRWCTRKENCNNPITLTRYSEATKWRQSHLGFGRQPRPVESIDTDGVVVRYESMHDAEVKTGVNSGSIAKCCNGKRQSAGGRKWRYAD